MSPLSSLSLDVSLILSPRKLLRLGCIGVKRLLKAMRSYSLLEVEDLCFGFICLFSERSVRQGEMIGLVRKLTSGLRR